MDILGSFPTTVHGNRYLLVIVDSFIKWMEALPALKNIRTRMMAEVFVDQVISKHGIPLKIHFDQGKNFEFNLFAKLMVLFDIKMVLDEDECFTSSIGWTG